MRAIAGAVLLVGALAVAGCDSNGGGGTTPPTSSTEPSIAENVPAGIDACNIPQDVLTSAYPGLRKGTMDDNSDRGKIKWRGCIYLVSDGYTASISSTNLTLAMIKEKHYPGERETTVNGRTVLITYQDDDPTGREACTLNAQMKGGSLEFSVSNPPSSKKTANLNPCDIGQTLAEKVVPLIQAGA
ncbi:DUF3558 domain-containing protein [Nocardia sp. NPDC048505]|uniref:DUF3558 domain-containing protein n=1 Tax=Nocardia sp. NPDC048505 TaxID=3155756 RepID=UPI0033D68A86